MADEATNHPRSRILGFSAGPLNSHSFVTALRGAQGSPKKQNKNEKIATVRPKSCPNAQNRKTTKKRLRARHADKRKNGLVAKTVFDLPKSFVFDRQNFPFFSCVFCGPCHTSMERQGAENN